MYGVTKGVDERIDEGVLRWFDHVEKMDRIPKRMYVWGFAGSCSVGRPQKRWTDTTKCCIRKNMFGCKASKENDG